LAGWRVGDRRASVNNKNPSTDAADGLFPAENGLSTTAEYLEAISNRKAVDYFSEVLHRTSRYQRPRSFGFHQGDLAAQVVKIAASGVMNDS
jgi:hypothetical protein